jgi:hypothetical protein
MERKSEHAARFIRHLSDVVQRLASRDIVTSSLRADYAHFGSWQLNVSKHHEEVCFSWDGRDGFLSIEGAPTPDSRAPRKWVQELVKGFDIVSGDDPVQYVETYLITRFPI